MRQLDNPSRLASPWRRIVSLLVVGASAVALTGCGRTAWSDGLLPHGVTEGSQRVRDLWIGTWILALIVGALVWGLLVWVMVAYRRKKDDNELPEQLRYHVPLEILYTVVPVFIVATLFYFTAVNESALIDTSTEPDNTVNVVGKQWSWDFNYVDDDVYETGVQASLTGQEGVEETLPTLYLVKGERVEFVLTARDVIHSFWVPAFLQKMDMIPGRVNKFQVVPTETGTFAGKCAELCGAYHSAMLFNVKVVEADEYEAHMDELRAKGQEGQLPNTLNREGFVPADEELIPSEGSN